jgi:hypothetical protein
MAGIEQQDQAPTAQRWCILRTSGGRTLALARSLSDAGLDVWTPVQSLTKRRGRTRERVAYDAPIMPTFVFARAQHLADLERIRELPAGTHPGFSIFRYLGRIPLISDLEVAGACSVEDRSRRAALLGTRKSIVVGSLCACRKDLAQACQERSLLTARASSCSSRSARSR